MTVQGIDYAWQHPDPSSLAAAGYGFACRYLSRDPSKNLTLSEAQALAAHGIWCVANWEYGAQDMLRGYAGGAADAQLALAQATAAGMPKGRPIYFSADWDVTPTQEAAVTAYLQGAASVLGGAAHVGEYAGYYPVRIARDNATATWTWQTSAWSGGQWDPRDTIRQTGSATVGGVQVDVNEALVPDFGQWQPGRLPFQSPAQEVTMPLLLDVQPDPANPNVNQGIWYQDGALLFHVVDPTQIGFFRAVPNVHEGPVSFAQFREIQARVAALGGTLTFTDAQAQAFGASIVAALPTADQTAAAVAKHLGADLAQG